MQFSCTMLAAAALATLASASTVQFQNQDGVKRVVIFTPNKGEANIKDLVIEGPSTVKQFFPDSWKGNFYAVPDGQPRIPSMLGEVSFNAWNQATYYDVSAIVNPNNNDGVKTLYPAGAQHPVSGCDTFPCTENSYYIQSDDLATLSTTETDLICTLGGGSSKRRRGVSAKFSRDYVPS